MFFKFRAISTPAIHEAILRSCAAVDNVNTARYFIHQGRLTIVYIWDNAKGGIDEQPEYQVCKDVLARQLSKEYQDFEVWDMERLHEVPEHVLERTGYVYLDRKSKVS